MIIDFAKKLDPVCRATRQRAFLHPQPWAHSETMVIFKCPYCGTEYEMTTAHLSFKQRSYTKFPSCPRFVHLHIAAL